MTRSRSVPTRAWLAASALALALVLGACGGSSDESDGDGVLQPGVAGGEEAAAAAAIEPIGTFAVGRTSRTFIDTSRPTRPNGSFPGTDSRELVTTIYYPTEGSFAENPIDDAPPLVEEGPYPLIFFSHGLLANGRVYENNIEDWVSAGYVAVAPDYPLSKTTAPGGASFGNAGDVVNQPADATYVLDQVLELDAGGELVAGTVIDPERIAAAGHSLGGITTLRWTYQNCCAEGRIDAAVPMSGIAVSPDEYFAGDTPVLLLHGDADALLPYRGSVDVFAVANPPKFLLTFTGAGHVTPFVGGQDAQNLALNEAVVAFFDRYLKDDPQGLERLRLAVRNPSVATLQEQES